MARMIPSTISPNVQSTAEKRIFRWFEKSENTEDWIILHSLGIANHETRLEGEVDFLVMVPRRGIFALEVKGGRVARDDEGWKFTDRHGNVNIKTRGPFEQARDAIYSIVRSLPYKVDHQHRKVEEVFFHYGVMFPDIQYDAVSIEEDSWQIFDCRDGDNVRDYIMRLSNGAREKWQRIHGYLHPDKLPTKQDIDYLCSILRGHFDKAVALTAKIKSTEDRLIELTKEQYMYLDQIEDNPRAVIVGAAGTGKTLLAIQEAKRQSIKGKKVALFCYNRNLSDWLNEYFKRLDESERPAFIGTFHHFLMELLKKAHQPIKMPESSAQANEFFSVTLPQRATEYLLEHDYEGFDKIVIDEAQDLLRSEYVDIFDLILKKGFEEGPWSMFGDFSKQAIYSDGIDAEGMMAILKEWTSFINFKLTINCRNTKEICSEIQTITGYDAPESILNETVGIPVDFRTYKDDQEASEKLKEVLDELKEKGISNEKITILSTRRRENSILRLIDQKSIKDYSIDENKHMTFSTIHSFKGLENTIIILIDIDNLQRNQLMYVALSRARTTLYIIYSEEAHQQYSQLMKQRQVE